MSGDRLPGWYPERRDEPREDSETGWEAHRSAVTITAAQVDAIKALVATEGLTWAEARVRIMGSLP